MAKDRFDVSSKQEYSFEFNCTCCGNCCREEGVVNFSMSEITKAAEYIGMSEKDFVIRYMEKSGKGYIHVVDSGGSCAFLKDGKCVINAVKPAQCASFPYWKDYVNRDGKLVNFDRHCAGVRIKKQSHETAGESS